MLLALSAGLILNRPHPPRCASFIHAASILKQHYNVAETNAHGDHQDPEWNRTWRAWAELFATDTTGCASPADKAQATADLSTSH